MARHLLFIVGILGLLTAACGTTSQVNTDNVVPTPFTPAQPVFIPTLAPLPATPSFVEPTAVVASTSDGGETGEEADVDDSDVDDPDADATSDAAVEDETAQAQETTEPSPTPEPRATPRPAAIPVPAPTSRPAPTRPPAPRPTAFPTATPRPLCPGGQVIVDGLCACPSGQAKRASDGQCVRFCTQSELTVSHSCVCTGELYDNGGQCVKRCFAGEVQDQFGGCKPAGT